MTHDRLSRHIQWVRKVLTLEGLVVNKRRPKHNFAARDLTRILITLWTQDDLIFIPERYRIQFTFIIRVYYWTGARLSAFFTDGLRWRDVDLVLQRVPRGGWRLIYYIKQRWVKNNRDPENIVFGAAGKEHEKFVYNDAAFLLATAVADGALFGYKMLDDVRKQEIPAGEDELILRYKESALFSATAQSCPIDIDSTQHGYRSGTTPLEWRSEVPLLRETLSTDSFLDADNDGEDVFSQFIRSPSRSPSATGDHTNDVKAANIRKNANIAASTSSLSSWSGSSTKHNVHVKDQNSHQSGPRIRLRVGPPKKITLRFTRPKTKNGAQWSPKRVRKGAKRSLLVR